MKVVTEFPGFVLSKALQTKTALLSEGKTLEEIKPILATSFKLEGDKLNFFLNAVDVATKQSGNLKRVVIFRLNEGETSAPPGATKIEELYYLPENLNLTTPKPHQRRDSKGGKRGRGGSGKGKESPWGLSPEEKAAAKAKKPQGTPTKPA